MKIALIGYGEVGRILGEDLRARGETVVACDLKLGNERGQALRKAAKAAGAAPLYRGQPGYRSALDGDDDGVACES